MRLITTLILLTTLMPLSAGLNEAFKDGKLILDLRFRLETVDQENIPDDATALTLRTRLGYETAAVNGWSLTVDFEDITAVDKEGYNSTDNGETTRPVIADPSDTELNRAHLTYKNDARSFVLGRQRIILDNARFVGNVGWRQNEQTYDAAMYQERFSKNNALTIVYLANANRIFGEHHSNPIRADLRQSSGIIHYKHKLGGFGDLALFGHFVDLDDLAAASHQNLGFRLNGAFKPSDSFALPYEVSYVQQSDFADGADIIDANYYMLSIGPKFGKFVITANYEVLGSNNGEYGFQTPLATLHAFNGWADRFLSTPVDGLEDIFLKFVWADKGYKVVAMYHDFGRERTPDVTAQVDPFPMDYGSELDLMITKKVNKHFDCGIKYADFQGDAFTDSSKIWAWGHYKF